MLLLLPHDSAEGEEPVKDAKTLGWSPVTGAFTTSTVVTVGITIIPQA
jgi:hypothetical protein